ncbi:hypothetical protein GCM10008938_28110 [Deinococcus roseus]|uniref:Uncharacterized protein n=1 Tax=Deinococcus roseus TaxID=392414 RepID=A0ABQ2D502_9DEIO|nr:hypothetical protein GCM10008938_28110 [Deinococcus roseus]
MFLSGVVFYSNIKTFIREQHSPDGINHVFLLYSRDFPIFSGYYKLYHYKGGKREILDQGYYLFDEYEFEQINNEFLKLYLEKTSECNLDINYFYKSTSVNIC